MPVDIPVASLFLCISIVIVCFLPTILYSYSTRFHTHVPKTKLLEFHFFSVVCYAVSPTAQVFSDYTDDRYLKLSIQELVYVSRSILVWDADTEKLLHYVLVA